MEPWCKVATPRKEVREGRSLSPNQFAIHLEQVISKTAPEKYREPVKFFSRTCFTRALCEGAGVVLQRLSGETANNAPAMTLITQFSDILSSYDASEEALYVLFHAVLAAHPKSTIACAVDKTDHGLTPRLARSLFGKICDWYLNSTYSRQIFLTMHNPLYLDGLPLNNDQVRLFTVSRTEKGRTVLNRIVLDERLKKMMGMGHLMGVANV